MVAPGHKLHYTIVWRYEEKLAKKNYKKNKKIKSSFILVWC